MENMPSLVECSQFDDDAVIKLLRYLPNSRFYGLDEEQVEEDIDRNVRRRYLNALAIINDQAKADFESVKELSSNKEKSSILLSLESSLRDCPELRPIVRLERMEDRLVE